MMVRTRGFSGLSLLTKKSPEECQRFVVPERCSQGLTNTDLLTTLPRICVSSTPSGRTANEFEIPVRCAQGLTNTDILATRPRICVSSTPSGISTDERLSNLESNHITSSRKFVPQPSTLTGLFAHFGSSNISSKKERFETVK
eukprot:748172_1